jgi:hypothetical protein
MTSRAAVALVLALLPLPSNAAYSPTSRLRPQSERIERWLATAERRSPTVRGLRDRIERSDVIVYLEIRFDLDHGVAACLTWVAATDNARIVRTSLRPDLREADAVSMIAHELQHVVEVIDHTEVRSNQTLLELYARIGHRTAPTRMHWDTEAAIAAGTVARLEAVGGRRPAARGVAS